MNREDIVAVAAKLFSIYLFILAVQFVASSISLNYQEAGMVPVVLIIVVAVVVCAISAYLWFFPLTVARGLLPVMKERDTSQPLNLPIALGLGLTLLGVWLFSRALSDLVFYAVLWARARGENVGVLQVTPDQYASLASAVVRFALSLFLMFGSAGLRRAFLRLRYAGSGSEF